LILVAVIVFRHRYSSLSFRLRRGGTRNIGEGRNRREGIVAVQPMRVKDFFQKVQFLINGQKPASRKPRARKKAAKCGPFL
jgi:hypothetical protein